MDADSITWKLFSHDQDTAEGKHYGANGQANDGHGAAWYNDDLAQHHKYPDDKHTQHVGAVEAEEEEKKEEEEA